MKKFLFITTFVVFIFIPISVSANVIINVIINEIAWMGTMADHNDEWIELKNTGTEIIDLAGWTLEAADGTPFINLEGNIATNSYFLLERTNDTSVPDITADQVYAGVLGNTGEYLKLKNNGVVVDEIDASEEWPAGDNTTKQTMQLVDSEWETGNPTPGTDNVIEKPEEPEEEPVPFEEAPTEAPPTTTGNQPPIARAGDNIIGFIGQEIEFDGTQSYDPDKDKLFYSWNMGDGKVIDKPSFIYKYSYPGTYLVTLTVSDGQDYALDTITIKIQSQQITINEFIPNPEGKDEENEWIEIYNGSDSITDISGWQLDDEDGGSKPFIFPENTLIAPKNYLVFSRQITKIALNNDKDAVRLLLPEGMVFQEINYENPKQGQSSARTDQGFIWSVPTPGMANIVSPPTNMGLGKGEGFVYQQPIEPETTKEPSQDYSWYFQNDFDKEIEGGYTFLPIKEQPKADDQFAAISNLAPQAKSNENQKAKQDILNLVLMIIAVILAGLIIGLFLTKLSKKFP